MQRRKFLKTSAGLAAVSITSSRAARGDRLVTPAATPGPGIVDIGSRKQLFLDDLLLDETSRISKFMYRPQKHAGNPIIVRDKPWENGNRGGHFEGVEITGQTVIYDEEERLFKMWYLPWPWEDGRRPWCYAVSTDGLAWEKPDLGIYEYRGSRQNNILADYSDPHYFNVVKDPHDTDPSRRYKAMGELEGPVANKTGGAAIAFSADGIHWNQYAGNPVVRHGRNLGDAPTMLGWDPRRKKYVFYPRPGHSLTHEIDGTGVHRHIRTIGYSESDDFLHWSPTRIMLAPNERDRVDFQYMQMTVGFAGEFYIGLLMIYQTHEQVWDTFLMSSRDGFHWNWVDRNVPFLGRGEVGAYDAGYMTPSGPIVHDGKVWMYYGAFSGAHSLRKNKLGRNVITIALATLPEDRWLALLAGPHRATIVTHPFTFTGTKLLVDLDASLPMELPKKYRNFDECELRAEILDQSGGRIDGFSIDRSTTLLESGRQELSWNGARLESLQGKPVRLRIEMRATALYSMQFV